MIDYEKIVKDVVDDFDNHPIEKTDIPVDAYSDVHNDLGYKKPKYHDPQLQRAQ